jgi:glycosyltransferase involved in cell wall biosynthesis
MKKSILICSHALEIGGAERALLGLLYSVDHAKYDVDLFLMRHEGELMNMIPKQVNLLPEKKAYTCLAVPMISALKKGELGVIGGRLVAKIKAITFTKMHRVSGDSGVELEYSHKYTSAFMPNISDKTYDIAISFLTPHYFVAQKVKAKQKIAWIHTDYSVLGIDSKSELKMWERYDHIASISDDCTKGFVNVFPILQNKIVLIENISSPNLIHRQAEELDVRAELGVGESTILLSVGRYCHQKNFDNVPDICRRMIEKGCNVKWYLIGFGPDEDFIKRQIEKYNMQNNVFILGKKSNPYPYMKACDIYVQPSRYEGKAVTVREAQILGKAVVITDYPTAASQVVDGIDGVIVPMDNETCAEALASILKDKEKLKMLRRNCEERNYDNREEVEKLYHLMGEKEYAK